MIHTKLDELVAREAILSYKYINLDQNGMESKPTGNRNTEQLEIIFSNGMNLTIETFCSGTFENTNLIIS